MVAIWVKVLIGLTVALLLLLCYLWKKPQTDFGKMSLRLCLVNAVGWFVLLPLSNKGHPPTIVLGAFVFWPLNLILLPVIALLLWICHKDQKENKSYLVIASIYVTLNVVLLYVVPSVGLIFSMIFGEAGR